MSKPNKANAGPGLKSTPPQKSPASSCGANVATKWSGNAGSSGKK